MSTGIFFSSVWQWCQSLRCTASHWSACSSWGSHGRQWRVSRDYRRLVWNTCIERKGERKRKWCWRERGREESEWVWEWGSEILKQRDRVFYSLYFFHSSAMLQATLLEQQQMYASSVPGPRNGHRPLSSAAAVGGTGGPPPPVPPRTYSRKSLANGRPQSYNGLPIPTAKPMKKFKLEDFQFVKLLGKGSFGKVYSVMWYGHVVQYYRRFNDSSY